MGNKKIQQSLDDIVFENRFKEYGAYDLRKKYEANLTKAFGLGVLAVLLVSLSSFLIVRESTKEVVKTPTYRTWDLQDAPTVIPDDPEESVEVPKPLIVKVATVEFPPIIESVPDNSDIVETDLPTTKELEIAAIGNENRKGETSIGSFQVGGEKEQNGIASSPALNIETPAIPDVVNISEIMPEFEGGMEKMYKWLGKNLRYPATASKSNIQGRVVVSFIVEKDGQITDIKILKGIGFGCDEEAVRAVGKMPKWNAGRQNGSPVRVRYTLPLNFQITD